MKFVHTAYSNGSADVVDSTTRRVQHYTSRQLIYSDEAIIGVYPISKKDVCFQTYSIMQFISEEEASEYMSQNPDCIELEPSGEYFEVLVKTDNFVDNDYYCVCCYYNGIMSYLAKNGYTQDKSFAEKFTQKVAIKKASAMCRASKTGRYWHASKLSS